MKALAIILTVLGLTTAVVVAQIDSAGGGVPSTGAVQSDHPAATTGTAPIDSNFPSGEATTGTSGTTMAEAAENNTSGQALIWIAVLAAAILLLVFLRKRRRAT